jgi:2'-5' RNA ligase
VRTFLAVELSDAARRAAGRVSEALRAEDRAGAVRWVRPENLHVTLRFLGEVEPARVALLVREVGHALTGEAGFEAQLGAVHAFPARRPRVVALEVEPAARLAALAEAVERGVVAAGFAPEPRRFHAHATLGRVRVGRQLELASGVAPEPEPFPVREVVLFESRLAPAGASYTPLERVALGGVASP